MDLRVDSIAVMLPGCKSKVAGSNPPRGEMENNQPSRELKHRGKQGPRTSMDGLIWAVAVIKSVAVK